MGQEGWTLHPELRLLLLVSAGGEQGRGATVLGSWCQLLPPALPGTREPPHPRQQQLRSPWGASGEPEVTLSPASGRCMWEAGCSRSLRATLVTIGNGLCRTTALLPAGGCKPELEEWL